MSGNPLGDLLGAILGGGGKSAAGGGSGAGGLLGSLLGALSSGGGGGGGGSGSNPLSQLFDMFAGPKAQPEVKEAAQSWVSTGENKPVSAEQLSQVLPTDAVHQAAEANGLTDDQALNELSKKLPEVVNEATPTGSVSDFDAVLSRFGLSGQKAA
ncbi:YidB family protein [Streptomyces sp. NPDC051940]|uniref:YidB family protein n=1 Tax=Streptomyces sp. NPDC051940 TaxID=3155675 RepID=UPI00342DEEAE